jgi:hypothetical protein
MNSNMSFKTEATHLPAIALLLLGDPFGLGGITLGGAIALAALVVVTLAGALVSAAFAVRVKPAVLGGLTSVPVVLLAVTVCATRNVLAMGEYDMARMFLSYPTCRTCTCCPREEGSSYRSTSRGSS